MAPDFRGSIGFVVLGFVFFGLWGGGLFICLFVLLTITNDACIQQKPCLSRFWILDLS